MEERPEAVTWLFRQLRSAFHFWSTDERFKWGARYQFVFMAPVATVAAIISAALGAWPPAILFAIAAAYMGSWLWRNRGNG